MFIEGGDSMRGLPWNLVRDTHYFDGIYNKSPNLVKSDVQSGAPAYPKYVCMSGCAHARVLWVGVCQGVKSHASPWNC